MKLEIAELEENQTLSIIDFPPRKITIGCRWFFKIKYKASWEVERYKARLVAKGYSQKDGLDYSETFSPIAKMVTTMSIVSLAVSHQWMIYHMDIHNAFLNGGLREEMYMHIPWEFAKQGGDLEGLRTL